MTSRARRERSTDVSQVEEAVARTSRLPPDTPGRRRAVEACLFAGRRLYWRWVWRQRVWRLVPRAPRSAASARASWRARSCCVRSSGRAWRRRGVVRAVVAVVDHDPVGAAFVGDRTRGRLGVGGGGAGIASRSHRCRRAARSPRADRGRRSSVIGLLSALRFTARHPPSLWWLSRARTREREPDGRISGWPRGSRSLRACAPRAPALSGSGWRSCPLVSSATHDIPFRGRFLMRCLRPPHAANAVIALGGVVGWDWEFEPHGCAVGVAVAAPGAGESGDEGEPEASGRVVALRRAACDGAVRAVVPELEARLWCPATR